MTARREAQWHQIDSLLIPEMLYSKTGHFCLHQKITRKKYIFIYSKRNRVLALNCGQLYPIEQKKKKKKFDQMGLEAKGVRLLD